MTERDDEKTPNDGPKITVPTFEAPKVKVDEPPPSEAASVDEPDDGDDDDDRDDDRELEDETATIQDAAVDETETLVSPPDADDTDDTDEPERDRAAAAADESFDGETQTTPDATVGEDPSGPNALDPAEVAERPMDFRERAKLLPDHDTWLERPSTVRGLIIGSLVALALTVVAEVIWVPHPKAHFEGIDGWIGFHAVYGFVACVLMVVGSKWIIGAVLKRKDTYYADRAPRTDEGGPA